VSRPQFPPPPLLDPGWYADPTGRYEARYWDGLKWTGHISHYGATGNDPILRAKFDRLWIRLIGKIVLWGVVLGLLFWVVKTYWPGGESNDGEKGASESIDLVSELEPNTGGIVWVLNGVQA